MNTATIYTAPATVAFPSLATEAAKTLTRYFNFPQSGITEAEFRSIEDGHTETTVFLGEETLPEQIQEWIAGNFELMSLTKLDTIPGMTECSLESDFEF